MPLNGARMYGLKEVEYRDPEDLRRGENWYGEYKEDLFSAAKDGAIHTWRHFWRKWYAFHDDAVLRHHETQTTADLKELLVRLRLHYTQGWQFSEPWFNSLLLPEVFAVTVLVHRLAEGSDGGRLEFWSDAFRACSEAGHLKYERQGAKGRLYVDEDSLAPAPFEAIVSPGSSAHASPALLQSYVRRNLSRLTEEAARASRRDT